MRICVLAVALALSVVAPAQAWTDGDSGDRPALSWWDAMVDTLATLFGLNGADNPPSSPPQGDPGVGGE